ncbi:hypothetical protein MTO98_15170 [Mucilaginibacter sp. SMC90]|uniref:hypothetical protein n=1 Tax=Mucilaginibacter sp. SMC90 TaxID=2929803 RepID=UPI001FB52688|nr:hypothetical protein [Mucilaginibacter sp. SMC90]UOE52416.1 hypothetical protein MTO98_15170 [Mucilaginibacter sp. SMC90]
MKKTSKRKIAVALIVAFALPIALLSAHTWSIKKDEQPKKKKATVCAGRANLNP